MKTSVVILNICDLSKAVLGLKGEVLLLKRTRDHPFGPDVDLKVVTASQHHLKRKIRRNEAQVLFLKPKLRMLPKWIKM